MDLGGVTAHSFGQGMLIAWRGDNWEYTALGHAPGDGVLVAGEILQSLPGNGPPLPAASQG